MLVEDASEVLGTADVLAYCGGCVSYCCAADAGYVAVGAAVVVEWECVGWTEVAEGYWWWEGGIEGGAGVG